MTWGVLQHWNVQYIFVSAKPACALLSVCMLMHVCEDVHASSTWDYNVIISEELTDGRCSSLTKDCTWNHPLKAWPHSRRWPLSSGVTWIPGYSLPNTAPLPWAPHFSLFPEIGWIPSKKSVCNLKYMAQAFWSFLVLDIKPYQKVTDIGSSILFIQNIKDEPF